MIKLNVKDGQFYAPTSVVEQFGKEVVQHQAHIVDILKPTDSHAIRGKETFNQRKTII